jgi:hypothetical protein
MPTNSFFSNYNFIAEQGLIEDLVIESIKIFGIDVYYLTRSLQGVDQILNEDDISIFDTAHLIEMYVKTVDGFQGEGDFLSKFGLQIRDQVTFSVAIKVFNQIVSENYENRVRPLEGDLIWLPLNKKFFKIMHVEHESVFYQTGVLQVYDIKCELFEHSNERFETGLPLLDNQYANIRTDGINSLEQLAEIDPIAKNIYFDEEKDDILDFTEMDPFSEEIYPPDRYKTNSTSTNPTADDGYLTGDNE